MDRTLVNDERFYSESLVERDFVMRTLDHYVRQATAGHDQPQVAAVDYFDAAYADAVRRSQMPEGAFSTLDRRRILEQIDAWITGATNRDDSLQAELACFDGNDLLTTVTLGCDMVDDPPQLAFPPLVLELGDGLPAVEVHGSTPYLWRRPDSGSCTIWNIVTGRPGRRHVPGRRVLQGFLFYMAARAQTADDGAGAWLGDEPVAVRLFCGRDTGEYRYQVTPDNARDYLRQLLRAFYADDVFDLMPMALFHDETRRSYGGNQSEIPLPFVPGNKATPQEKAKYQRRLQFEVEQARGNPFSRWYHSPLLDLLELEVPDDCWDKIHARFVPFFDVCRDHDG